MNKKSNVKLIYVYIWIVLTFRFSIFVLPIKPIFTGFTELFCKSQVFHVPEVSAVSTFTGTKMIIMF